MDPALDERLGDLEMEVVGRDDGDEVDALPRRERRLALGHRVVALVYALRIEIQLASLRARFVPVRREGARGETREAIHCGSAAVHGADESTRTAADHSEAQLPSGGHRTGSD